MEDNGGVGGKVYRDNGDERRCKARIEPVGDWRRQHRRSKPSRPKLM